MYVHLPISTTLLESGLTQVPQKPQKFYKKCQRLHLSLKWFCKSLHIMINIEFLSLSFSSFKMTFLREGVRVDSRIVKHPCQSRLYSANLLNDLDFAESWWHCYAWIMFPFKGSNIFWLAIDWLIDRSLD